MSTTYENAVCPDFDGESESYEVYHDPDSSWKVSTTLVLALSSLTGNESTEMPPLSRAVDPDMLESHVHDQVRKRDVSLSFDFHGYHIKVQEDGQIVLTPLGEQKVPIHGD